MLSEHEVLDVELSFGEFTFVNTLVTEPCFAVRALGMLSRVALNSTEHELDPLVQVPRVGCELLLEYKRSRLSAIHRQVERGHVFAQLQVHLWHSADRELNLNTLVSDVQLQDSLPLHLLHLLRLPVCVYVHTQRLRFGAHFKIIAVRACTNSNYCWQGCRKMRLWHKIVHELTTTCEGDLLLLKQYATGDLMTHHRYLH